MAKEPIDIDPAGRPGLPGVEILASVKDVPTDVISETVQETPTQGAATGPPSSSYQDTLIWFVAQAADEFAAWGAQSSKVRDKQLRAFIGTESQFTSALGIVITRNSAFNWELEGEPRSADRVHQILTEANMGEGWENFIAKVSLDLYTQDAGSFVEVVRDGALPTSPLIGINHLDSARCWHTGDPLKPVIYQDVKQKFHLLNWWNVVTLSEMPTAIEGLYGLQWCAETRLMMAAQIMRNIAIYKKEKSGGRNTRAIHLVQGLTTEQVNDAIGDLKNRADAEGFMRYMQPVVIGSHDPQATLDVKTLELASLPDGFDEKTAFDQYVNMIAMAFQSDYQEFAPLPGGNLGTSMQSQVLHMKSRGKGPGLFMKLIKNMMNNRILPKNVRFSFEEQDLDAEQAQADISKTRAEARKMRIEAGELTAEEARQIAVDNGDLPQALFEATPATDISPPERVVTQESGPGAEEGVRAGESEVSPEVNPFGLQMTEIGIRQTEPARAGPFEDERLKAERRLTLALSRAFRKNFDAVKKRLRRENRATKEIRYKQLGDLLDDTEFWGLRQTEFMAEVGGQPLELLLDGGQQAERLGLTFDFNLVNQDALRETRQFTNRWWQELSVQTREGMRTAIATHIESGAPLRVLNKNLEPLFGKARANVIARTEVTRMYAEGNRIAYGQAGIRTVEWRTVRDANVDPICDDLHGTRMPLGQEQIVPPAHPRCLPGNTRIAAQSISASSERWYDGEFIIILTAGGKQLSCTPNHPILTQSGWVAAGELDVGSYVVAASGGYWETAGNNKHQYMPTTIKEITETFRCSRQVITSEVPVSPEDFHSDGIGSEVAIIRSDRLLVDKWNVVLGKQVTELPFIEGDSPMSMSLLNRQGSVASFLKTDMSSTGRSMSGYSLPMAFGGRHLRPLKEFGISASAWRNVVIDQPLVDRTTIDPILLGQLILGNSAEVTLDQIVDRKVSSFHGYVYNLQTESGAYLAEGIVTHNCRCWLAPVVDAKPILKE